MKNTKIKHWAILAVLALVLCILPLYVHGQDGQRASIDVNLIIDGSSAYSAARDEIFAWLSGRLDQILADGDRVTVWSAGQTARVIYSGVITSSAEKEAVKRSIREINASGNTADFSGALREAANRQSSTFSYTLLITASPQSISGSTANLLRYSRVEEFPNWRALVVGLNFDTKIKRAANSFFGS
ncbi:MAG: hypothetical protein LBU88_05850 [Treponema sp.]|jgi:hypothetical protein|nr:hypothetical protein [Treponema sp.]